MEEEPPLTDQLLRLLGLQPREARACTDRVLGGAGGVELGVQGAVEVAGAAGGHKAGVARVGADRRCGLGEEEETKANLRVPYNQLYT